MGERIRRSEIVERWHRRMPRFFYWVTVIASGVLFVSVSIHLTVESAGAVHADWWQQAYPYLVGASAGIIAVCKFTVAGGYKKVDPDKIGGHTILDKDDN